MKKFLLSIIAVLLIATMCIGCGSSSVDPLDGVNGEVKSTNGSYVVEKGDYVYFVNGKDELSSDNTFGKPVKSALMRIKTTDLQNPENANVEVVVPKLMLSESYKTGVFFYGDYVFYATPSIKKDKKGNVKYEEVEFHKLNLVTGKADSSEIAVCGDNTTEYRFVENNGKVYLLFVEKTSTDEGDESVLKVYNAIDKKEVYTSPVYAEMLMPENNGVNVYFTKFSEGLEEDTNASFHDIYRYTVGDADAKIVRSGTGSVDLQFNNRTETVKNAPQFDESGFQGVTINLIKNTGKYLIAKVSTLDASNKTTVYYGFDVEADANLVSSAKYLGISESSTTDKAYSSTSYIKSLEEVYYIDNGDSGPKGLILFNYTKMNDSDKTRGRTVINSDCSDYTIQFVDGDYLYLAKTAEGLYYRLNLAVDGAEVKQINGVSMQTSTSWYAPTVIQGKYFIGVYTKDFYKNYLYVIDMSNIDAKPSEGEENNEFEKTYILPFADAENIERTSIEALLKTRVGKITTTDSDSIETLLNEEYKED